MQSPLRISISSITKAWVNPIKVADSAFTRELPCRQIPSQLLQTQDQQHQKKEMLLVTGIHVQAVVESLLKRPS